MKKLFIIIYYLLIHYGVDAAPKKWSFWKELPSCDAPVTFLHAHQKDLYVGDKDGQIYIYKVEQKGYRAIHSFNAHIGEVSHIEVNSKGTALITAGYDGWVRLYDTEDFLLLREFKNTKVKDYDGTKGLEATFATFSKDGQSLFIGGYNRHLVQVDIRTGKSDTAYFDSTYAITCGEIIPSLNQLAFGFGGEVRFLDVETNKMTSTVIGQHGSFEDYVCEVAYVPHKDWLSVWLVSGDVRLYDAKTKQLMMEVDASNEQGSCRVGVSNDGAYLATGNTPDVAIFSLKNRRYQQRLQRHQKTVTSSVFMMGANVLATGANDHKVVLWRKGEEKKVPDVVRLNGVPTTFKVGDVFVLEDLQFDQSSYALRVDAKKELDKLVQILRKYPAMQIQLEGHTSNEGDAKKNMDLSKQRVMSARNYLISKGVKGDQVMVKGFGENKPRADNSALIGRIANRRIEMRIISI